MSYTRRNTWTLNTSVNRSISDRLISYAGDTTWWKSSVNILTDMVIQLLARNRMTEEEIAAYTDCSPECVRLIACHYRRMVIHAANEHKALAERRNTDVGI